MKSSERSKDHESTIKHLRVAYERWDGYVAAVRCMSMRERILRFLLGGKRN